MFFGYVLKSTSSSRYYIGHAEDLEKRVKQHNGGVSRYTRTRGPWVLVYHREFPTRSEAMNWEIWLKKRKSKKFIDELVAGRLGPDYK